MLVAYILYVFVENPARNAEFWADARPRRSLVTGIVASVAVVALSAGSLALTTNTPLSTSQAAASVGAGQMPVGTAYVPSNLTPSLQDADTDNPAIYDNGCHRDFESTDASGCQIGADASAPVVALFGDSHAAQWYPALEGLAEAGEIRLEVDTKSSCPSVSVNLFRDGSPYTECAEWRTGVIERLAAEPPTLVLLSNYGRADLHVSDSQYASAWGDGLQETIDALSSSEVAVLSDTPDMGSTPAICLSANLDDAAACARPVTEAINQEVRAVEQAVSGATYLDFTGYFCDEQTCPAVIGSTLVYRDAIHMTATFSSELSEVVDAQVRELLGG